MIERAASLKYTALQNCCVTDRSGVHNLVARTRIVWLQAELGASWKYLCVVLLAQRVLFAWRYAATGVLAPNHFIKLTRR